ncbi:hypothetical protein HFC66_12290 [Escherichia coli]|nr:hypothetical protein HFC67_21430 [Escherichia coli]QIV73046.1 hypothetical protein HFC66_12290 [Escherichia coli]
MRAEIALMSGSAFAVTHHAFSSGAGRTSDGNGSHASTLKSPSYTKSVSWQHYHETLQPEKISYPFYLKRDLPNEKDINYGVEIEIPSGKRIRLSNHYQNIIP